MIALALVSPIIGPSQLLALLIALALAIKVISALALALVSSISGPSPSLKVISALALALVSYFIVALNVISALALNKGLCDPNDRDI